MHTGIQSLGEEKAGFLFMQGDQPLILPGTLERLVREFLREPGTPIRLGYAGIKGSPVIFPAGLRQALLSYEGDRGGMEVLRRTGFPCRILEASHEWELWDVDTPDSMEKARKLLCQGL